MTDVALGAESATISRSPPRLEPWRACILTDRRCRAREYGALLTRILHTPRAATRGLCHE